MPTSVGNRFPLALPQLRVCLLRLLTLRPAGLSSPAYRDFQLCDERNRYLENVDVELIGCAKSGHSETPRGAYASRLISAAATGDQERLEQLCECVWLPAHHLAGPRLGAVTFQGDTAHHAKHPATDQESVPGVFMLAHQSARSNALSAGIRRKTANLGRTATAHQLSHFLPGYPQTARGQPTAGRSGVGAAGPNWSDLVLTRWLVRLIAAAVWAPFMPTAPQAADPKIGDALRDAASAAFERLSTWAVENLDYA
jgi:hypothetical protein